MEGPVAVCIDRPILSLDRPFTYLLPPELDAGLGSLVQVPFHGRLIRGWVLGAADAFGTRTLSVRKVVSPVRFFDEAMLELIRWVSERYVAPLAAVIGRVAPPRVASEEGSWGAGAQGGGGGGRAPLAQPSHAPLRGAAAAFSPPTLPSSHPLSDSEFHAAVGAVDDILDVSYEWDAGEAMGAFLEGLRDGRIVATHCVACERTLVPPRKFCERCFRPTDRWEEVAATGLVETFSICHVSWDMQPLDPPELPAVIRLDGASEGGFLHKLGEVSPDDVRIGMAVEAVWRPLEERTGSILDIAYFRPRSGGDG